MGITLEHKYRWHATTHDILMLKTFPLINQSGNFHIFGG